MIIYFIIYQKKNLKKLLNKDNIIIVNKKTTINNIY